jgi:hypothetical protein
MGIVEVFETRRALTTKDDLLEFRHALQASEELAFSLFRLSATWHIRVRPSPHPMD